MLMGESKLFQLPVDFKTAAGVGGEGPGTGDGILSRAACAGHTSSHTHQGPEPRQAVSCLCTRTGAAQGSVLVTKQASRPLSSAVPHTPSGMEDEPPGALATGPLTGTCHRPSARQRREGQCHSVPDFKWQRAKKQPSLKPFDTGEEGLRPGHFSRPTS